MSPGAYYAAPEGGGPARLLAIVAVAMVVGGGGIWLARTKPWLPPAPEPQEEQEAAAAPAREIALPIAPPAPEDEEEEAASPAPARVGAGALPVVFVEGFACRAVESNSTWMAVAWQASIGTSSPDPSSGLSAVVTVLDADGFVLDDQTAYNVSAAPGDSNVLQDRILVNHPQASRVSGCKIVLKSGNSALDSSMASVEMAIPPPRQRQAAQAPPAAIRPAYTPQPAAAAKVWGDPKVHRYGSRAVVAFRIWNPGAETITANVDVELYLNGEFVSSEGDLVEVGPGDKRLFEVTFDGVGQGGRATASVRVQ